MNGHNLNVKCPRTLSFRNETLRKHKVIGRKRYVTNVREREVPGDVIRTNRIFPRMGYPNTPPFSRVVKRQRENKKRILETGENKMCKDPRKT